MQIETLTKPRVIVLTDITNEPDDEQSMVRFLCYANEFDVEGLVATTSCWLRNKVVPERIRERVEAYGQIRNNLLKHASDYPETDHLLNVIKSGVPIYGMEGIGKGQSSAGSNLIIEAVDKPDPRPVWVCVWGGVNCLAQALWEVKHTRSQEEIDAFVSKLRIYTISDQDDTAPWIRRTFPNLFYIVSPGYEENGGGAYHYSTWVGISGDKFHGRFDGADFSIVDNPWLDQHIRQNHGPLGELHPQTKYLLEGDTPTFLYLIPNGLGVPEKPNYGNWGGRYESYIPNQQKWHYEQEARPIWTDAADEVIGVDGKTYKTNQATIWRWRQAYQHDFAARIDWTVAENYQDANHNPVAAFADDTGKGVITLRVKSGEEVTLSAAGTFDPDGHNILYYWFVYKEVSDYKGKIVIDGAENQEASLIAPEVDLPQNIHVVLQVKDGGEPCLYSYRRIIVSVIPR
ncbi:TPA: DUF1593 domain-containing protein [Candidatus Poribacteria bacterium]|nr:DUF1593 domain-containing protein [Candidatus Poribacteria bacterium]